MLFIIAVIKSTYQSSASDAWFKLVQRSCVATGLNGGTLGLLLQC